MEIFEIISTLISFIGTVIIAFAVIENPGGAHQGPVKLASILLPRFRLGICLLTLGFFIHMVQLLNLS